MINLLRIASSATDSSSKINKTRDTRGDKNAPRKNTERQNMNMNKKDKNNIVKIEALRARLVNEEKERGGLVLHIDGRAVEISIEREKTFEQVQARFVDFQYNDARKQLEPAFFDVVKIVSDYLTSAEIYNVVKAGVNSFIERGF